MAKLYIAIGIGGMIGAIGRYGISVVFVTASTLPYATLTANLIGCFLLSFLLNNDNIKQMLAPKIHTAISVGIIGSFTTFSTFAIETIELWNNNGLFAVIYIVSSICGGLGFCYCGYKLATRKQVRI